MSPVPGTTTAVPPSSLATYHRNPRRGDVGVIESSLRVNGQYRPVVGNIGTHTGRPLEILAGNHTLMAFRNLAEANPFDRQWSQILVHWVDVDDDRAARIVAVDNRSGEVGGIDTELLYELLSELPDVDGTGYNSDDLDLFRPLDLDALAATYGEGMTAEDMLERVYLVVSREAAEQWYAHRENHVTDHDALAALL